MTLSNLNTLVVVVLSKAVATSLVLVVDGFVEDA